MGLFKRNKTVKIEPDVSYINETVVKNQQETEAFTPFFDPKKGRADPIITYKFHPETLDEHLNKASAAEPFRVYKTDILTLDIMNNELNAKLDQNVNSFYQLHKNSRIYNQPDAYDLEVQKAKVKEHEVQKQIHTHIDKVRKLDKEYMDNFKNKQNRTLVFNPTQKMELSSDERIRLAERRLNKVQDNYIPLERLEKTATLKLPITNYSKFNKWIREESALYSKKAPGTKSFLSTNNKRIKSYNAIPIALQKIKNLENTRNNAILDKSYDAIAKSQYLKNFENIDVYKNGSKIKQNVYNKADAILGTNNPRGNIKSRLNEQLHDINATAGGATPYNTKYKTHQSYEQESLFDDQNRKNDHDNISSSSIKTKYFGNVHHRNTQGRSADIPRTLKIKYPEDYEKTNNFTNIKTRSLDSQFDDYLRAKNLDPIEFNKISPEAYNSKKTEYIKAHLEQSEFTKRDTEYFDPNINVNSHFDEYLRTKKVDPIKYNRASPKAYHSWKNEFIKSYLDKKEFAEHGPESFNTSRKFDSQFHDYLKTKNLNPVEYNKTSPEAYNIWKNEFVKSQLKQNEFTGQAPEHFDSSRNVNLQFDDYLRSKNLDPIEYNRTSPNAYNSWKNEFIQTHLDRKEFVKQGPEYFDSYKNEYLQSGIGKNKFKEPNQEYFDAKMNKFAQSNMGQNSFDEQNPEYFDANINRFAQSNLDSSELGEQTPEYFDPYQNEYGRPNSNLNEFGGQNPEYFAPNISEFDELDPYASEFSRTNSEYFDANINEFAKSNLNSREVREQTPEHFDSNFNEIDETNVRLDEFNSEYYSSNIDEFDKTAPSYYDPYLNEYGEADPYLSDFDEIVPEFFSSNINELNEFNPHLEAPVIAAPEYFYPDVNESDKIDLDYFDRDISEFNKSLPYLNEFFDPYLYPNNFIESSPKFLNPMWSGNPEWDSYLDEFIKLNPENSDSNLSDFRKSYACLYGNIYPESTYFDPSLDEFNESLPYLNEFFDPYLYSNNFIESSPEFFNPMWSRNSEWNLYLDEFTELSQEYLDSLDSNISDFAESCARSYGNIYPESTYFDPSLDEFIEPSPDEFIEPSPEIFMPYMEILNIGNTESMLVNEEINFELEKIDVEIDSVRNYLESIFDSNDDMLNIVEQNILTKNKIIDWNEILPINNDFVPYENTYYELPNSYSSPSELSLLDTIINKPSPLEANFTLVDFNEKLIAGERERQKLLKNIPVHQEDHSRNAYDQLRLRHLVHPANDGSMTSETFRGIANEIDSILGITSKYRIGAPRLEFNDSVVKAPHTLGFSNRSKNKVNLLPPDQLKAIREGNKLWDKHRSNAEQVKHIQSIRDTLLTDFEINEIKNKASMYAKDEVERVRKQEVKEYVEPPTPMIKPAIVPAPTPIIPAPAPTPIIPAIVSSVSAPIYQNTPKAAPPIISPTVAPITTIYAVSPIGAPTPKIVKKKQEDKNYISQNPKIKAEEIDYVDSTETFDNDEEVIYINRNSVAHNKNIILSDFSFGDNRDAPHDRHYEPKNRNTKEEISYYENHRNRPQHNVSDEIDDPNKPNVKWYKFSTNRLVDDPNDNRPISPETKQVKPNVSTQDHSQPRPERKKTLSEIAREARENNGTQASGSFSNAPKTQGSDMEKAKATAKARWSKAEDMERYVRFKNETKKDEGPKKDFNDYRRELHASEEVSQTNAFFAKTTNKGTSELKLGGSNYDPTVSDKTKVLDLDAIETDANGIPRKKLFNNLNFKKTNVVDLYEPSGSSEEENIKNRNAKGFFKKRTTNLENNDDVFEVNNKFSKSDK